MSKSRGVVLSITGGLIAAALLLLGFNAEWRGELLLLVAPQYFREVEFLRLTNPAGEEVYLLGTIHGGHLTTKGYSMLHLQAVIAHLKPDLLLVESRPEELARDNWGDGPVEMPFASLTARAEGIPVQGMDWWTMTQNHQIDSAEREDRMFQNILADLPDHHRVLILTGFSHVAGFQQRFLARGYHQAAFSSAEKEVLFDTTGQTLLFPPGMTYYIEKRIAVDRSLLQNEADSFWRDRIENAIADRQALLKTIAAVGERQP